MRKETMHEYVIRRAFEVKDYRQVCLDSGLGLDAYEWLRKFARGTIGNSGISRVEKLYHFYKALEASSRRKAA